jgi:hypothetical protein
MRHARVFRVRDLPPALRALCWGGAAVLAFSACAANCLRDSDCGDAYLCRHDRCELAPASGPDAGASAGAGAGGQAGAATLPSNPQNAGAGGVGGSAVAIPSFGGSASDPRENLDASVDADAATDPP